MKPSVPGLPLLLSASMLLLLVGSARAQGASADQYYQYGNRYYSAKDYQNAARYYGAAVRVDPNHAASWQGLGNAYYALGQRQQALQYYERALQLNPNNVQLSQFVQRLRGQVGGAQPAAQPPAGGAFARGKALFAQKQYAAALPHLRQAVQETPENSQAHYYLGYAQSMTGDKRGAALSFARSAQLSGNAQVKAYADRLKAGLPAADQKWVDAKLAKGPGGAEKPKKFGIRALPGIAVYKIDDFEADADLVEESAQSFGLALDGSVPQGNLYFGLEPFFRPMPALDLAVGFAFFPVGKYSYTLTDDASGTKSSMVYDAKATVIPFTVRGVFGKGRTQFYVGAGAGLYNASIDFSSDVSSAGSSMGSEGSFSSSGMGFHGTVGADFRLASSVGVSPYLLFRSAKIKDFSGTLTDSAGGETDVEMVFDENSGGIGFMDPSAGPAPAGARPFEMDLTGLQFGLMVSVFF